MPCSPVVQLVGITKTYGNGPVLKEINLDLYPGQVLGVIGANGSGKTTAMRILSGGLRADSGEIRINQRPVNFESPADAIAQGIRMLPQFLELYPSLSIVENIFIGQEIVRRWHFPRLMAWRAMRTTASSLAASEAVRSRAKARIRRGKRAYAVRECL
ncbi:MAG: ATP-binding cassette domain-containing protein [Planctomycetes bacterium]|nr:ATP-binding cassette domain-containing protein [Planctomycetota bacterium]